MQLRMTQTRNVSCLPHPTSHGNMTRATPGAAGISERGKLHKLPPTSKRKDHRSRTPCGERDRSSQQSAKADLRGNRNTAKGNSANKKHDRSRNSSRHSEGPNSSHSTSSSKQHDNKKTAAKNRSSSRHPIEHRDRAERILGIRFDTEAQPRCKLGHILTFPHVQKLATFVEPMCVCCPRRFVLGSPCAVCHQCEPTCIACLTCAMRLLDEDTFD